MAGAGGRRWPVLASLWIALLAWVVAGGALAQLLIVLDGVGPYCASPESQQDIYPVCAPCALSSGAFGVVGMNPCPNVVLAGASFIGLELPHVIVTVLVMVCYALEEPLRRTSAFLPACVLIAPLTAALVRTVYFNFWRRPHATRGLNRALLVCLGILAINLAMMWGGAWPWLRSG